MTTPIVRGFQAPAIGEVIKGQDEDYHIVESLTTAEDRRRQEEMRSPEYKTGVQRELQRGGGIREDYDRFSHETAFVRLYRKVTPTTVQPVRIPSGHEEQRLRKRVRDQNSPNYGQPIFYTVDQVERNGWTLDAPHSAPCPVNIGGALCGQRMRDEVELYQHIQAYHKSVAWLYLAPEDIDRLRAKSRAALELSVESLAPAPFQASLMTEAEKPNAAEKRPKAKQQFKTSLKHTCEHNGAFGRREPGCLACEDLERQKQEQTA